MFTAQAVYGSDSINPIRINTKLKHYLISLNSNNGFDIYTFI